MSTMTEGWLTIPEWPRDPVVDVFAREQAAAELPKCGLPANQHVLVRAVLELPEGDCCLQISADDSFQGWLDGAWLDCGPAPAYPDHYYYRSYAIKGGRRAVLALHVYYQGLVNRVNNSGDGRLGFFIRAAAADGKAVPAAVRCMRCDAYSGDTVGYETQFLENFDSRRWPEGWEQPAYDDSAWQPAVPALWADYTMAEQPTQAIQWEELQPEIQPLPGGLLLDFGREITGMLTAEASGPRGAKVTLRFGEELDANGRVRFDMRCNCRYEEIWTLDEGRNILHAYDYKAFRYAEIVPEQNVKIEQIGARFRHYPMDPDACVLSCPQDQLEDIFRICRQAVCCATQEGFLDCPSREKGQYLGDAIITARSQIWLTGDTRMLRKCIRDFRASQAVSPGFMAVAPGSLMQEIADFSLLFPLLPLTDYEFTGDREFLREGYAAAARMIEAFSVYERADGLLENVAGQWNLVDWPENLRDGYDFPLTRPIVGKGCHNVVNALWIGALQMKQKMERILGLSGDDGWKRRADAYMRAFYRPEQKLFADSEASSHCSLHANLYAAYFGILPREAEDAFEQLLCSPGRVCGVLPMSFALRALARLGRYDALYRLLTRQDAFGWRNMLAEGATSCFEAWGKEQKWNTSLCHPWASGPIFLIIEELAGFHPDPSRLAGFRFEPGFPDPPEDFFLEIPFRGRRYRIHNEKNMGLVTEAL